MGKSRNKIAYNGKVFEHEQIRNGNCYLACSLLSDSLEVNTLEFDLASEDTTLTDFERNTPVIYYRDDVQVGIFYLQSVERTGINTYHFMANSAIGLLTEGQHMGGIYTGQTVAEVLPSICGTIPYYIKSELKDIALYGWLPIAAPRDNLSQVLFAIGATVKTDLDGALRIESLWDGLSGFTGKDQMYTGAKVEYASKVTRVLVMEHQYVEGSESEQLFEGTAQQGDMITFNEPMHHLTASGFEILESGANYAKLSSGSGALSGRKYIHNTRQVAKDVSAAREVNIKSVKDATLVSLTNSEAVANRLVNFYRCIETINAAGVYHGEVPGNIVSAYHAYDRKQIRACIQTADINLSNTLKSQEKSLVGFAPIKDEKVYDAHEVLTGSGTWTVPDGVTSVRMVLIGGGQDGQKGTSGQSSGDGIIDSNEKTLYKMDFDAGTKSISVSMESRAYSAGKGGEGGKGGDGGKVYEATVDVLPGSQIAFSCGENSAEPTETRFGEYTSESGANNPAGYTDLITMITYAASGLDGNAGGNGGSGGAKGSESADGTAGGDGTNAIAISESDSYSGLDVYSTQVTGTIGACGGGGGGGGSGQVKGSRGGSAIGEGECEIANAAKDRVDVYHNYAGNGGNGGNGENAKTYGSGGNGGGGGGGAGAFGLTSATATLTATEMNKYTSYIKLTMFFWQRYITVSGFGGSGGSGGLGAPGCIILYYSRPVKVRSGPVVGKDGLLFLTRHEKRFVV